LICLAPEWSGLILKKMGQLELLISEHPSYQTDQNELFNVTQAAKFLDMAVPTLYSKVCRREIPVNKKGKRLYFYKSELQEWIKEGRKRTLHEINTSIEFRQKKRKP